MKILQVQVCADKQMGTTEGMEIFLKSFIVVGVCDKILNNIHSERGIVIVQTIQIVSPSSQKEKPDSGILGCLFVNIRHGRIAFQVAVNVLISRFHVANIFEGLKILKVIV